MQITFKLNQDDWELVYGFLYGLVHVANPDEEVKRVARELLDQLEPDIKKHLGMDYAPFMQILEEKLRETKDMDAVLVKKYPLSAEIN